MSFVTAGGTGTVGSKVTRELLARGHQVRVLTRDVERAAGQLGRRENLEFFPIDFSDPSQLAGGFRPGDRVFLGLGGSMTQVRDESALIDAAAAAGAGYLVRLSCNGVDTSTSNVILDGHRAVESHLGGAGIPWTLIRPSTFIDAIVRIASMFISQDAWGGNDAGGLCTFVDTRDVAEVFAAVLEQGPQAHQGQVYTLTGPEAVSMAHVAGLISAATGRPVRHHPRTESASESFLSSLGLPALQVAVLLGLDQFCREATMGDVRDDTRSILGQPARSVAAYVNETAASLLQPA